MRGAGRLAAVATLLACGAGVARAQGTPPDTVRKPKPPRDTSFAVPIPPRPDSIKPDTGKGLAKGIPTDSAAAKRDTIKAPLAHAESPVLTDVGPTFHWDRAALFASGALTLTDLLERVPGMTTLRAGWVNEPMSAAYLGDVGKVRVFYDGVELDALDPRTGGSLDLTTIELWTLEDVAIERGADEVRVYLRSWRTQRTTTNTRTDITTGDEDTNLYRGFFGKRFGRGEALQLAFQQYSTTSPRYGGGGDQLSILARMGVARGRWSVDAFALRANRTRSDRFRSNGSQFLSGEQPRNTEAYVRAGYGDPDAGPWLQLTAASLGFRETTPKRAASANFAADSADTTRSTGQYVAAAGFTRWGFRLSATERLRTFQGQSFNAASARASFDRRLLALSLFGERTTRDSAWRGEALARVRLLPFIAVAGAASVVKSDVETGRPQSTSLRGEADLRVGGLWLGGGVLVRDSALLRAPRVFDTTYVPLYEGKQTGSFATVRGHVWKIFYADAQAVRWQDPGFYRPREQTRSELFLRTDWRRRFPSGNFGFLLSALHEYRGTTFFPIPNPSDPNTVAAEAVAPSRVLSFLLEIRIVNATLTAQVRNALGELYQQVPGYEMPRPTTIYGVRWEFWN